MVFSDEDLIFQEFIVIQATLLTLESLIQKIPDYTLMTQPFPEFLNTLHWRHNDPDSVSNHQPHGCLLNRLFRRRSKKTSKLRVTGLCVGNSPGPVNSPHKGPVTRKMFPFDDVIMISGVTNCDAFSFGRGVCNAVVPYAINTTNAAVCLTLAVHHFNDGLGYWI